MVLLWAGSGHSAPRFGARETMGPACVRVGYPAVFTTEAQRARRKAGILGFAAEGRRKARGDIEQRHLLEGSKGLEGFEERRVGGCCAARMMGDDAIAAERGNGTQGHLRGGACSGGVRRCEVVGEGAEGVVGEDLDGIVVGE